MSIREWAYNQFANRYKAVSDDNIIIEIQSIFLNGPVCCAIQEPSRGTVMRWLDHGMTADEYHGLYLMLKDAKQKDVELLNPKILYHDYV